jgi:glutaredoxin 3
MADVVIYSEFWCPYCTRAKQLLDKKGVTYLEIEAPNGSEAREEARSLSGRTSVPQIVINGKAVGGYDDISALERAGQLDALLAS